MSVLLLAMVQLGHGQAQAVGDWQGVATIEGADYHIIVHITAAKDGSLAATLDSPELSATGITTSGVTFKDGKFTMNVEAYHGVYTGTLSGDGTKITGAFEGDHEIPIEFARMAAGATPAAATTGGATRAGVPATTGTTAASTPATPSDIDGTWAGTLDVNGQTLHILIKVTNTSGGLTAQVQSPDQSPMWLSASTVTRENGTLTASFTVMQAQFSGRIAADLGTIDGTISQGGGSMPLVLKRQQ